MSTKTKRKIKILTLDCETAPNTAYVWGLWKENIPLQRLVDSGYVMCWSAKWYGDREIMFDSIHQSTQRQMLGRIHKLLWEADAVIHYNGKAFDIPTLNREFVVNGFAPPPASKQIDLLTTVRRNFKFPSNKLDYVVSALGIGSKTKGLKFETWEGCINGDDKSWRLMEKYNKQDVRLTEKLYDAMLPWIKQHPNMALFLDDDRPLCHNCGSARIHKRGFAYTDACKYQRYYCTQCKTWQRSRRREKLEQETLTLTR